MRLEIVVGDAPILDRHVLGQKFRAIALGKVRLGDEIARKKAPGLGIPVQSAAADPVAEHEGAPVAHRQRGLTGIVAKRHRGLGRPQKQIVPDAEAQLVLRHGRREFRRRVAPGTALDRGDAQAGFAQFVSEDRPGPSEPDDDGILRRQLLRHGALRADGANAMSSVSLMETGGSVTGWLGRSTHSR